MKLVVDSLKKRTFKRFIHSFGNSFDGLCYAYKHEQSMVLHLSSCISVLVLGMVYQITPLEWSICVLLLGLIAATELVNTSIEAVVDLITQKIHPLAKVAKDTASGAVFIFSFVTFLGFLMIFIPKMIS